MRYTLKWPNGPAYEYSLEQLRTEYKAGKFTDDCIVRRNGTEAWQTVRQLLEQLGEIQPLTESQLAARAAGKSRHFADRAARRYRDAYLVARATEGIGSIVKFIGFLCGAVIAITGVAFGAGFAPGTNGAVNPMIVVGGVILAVLVTVPFYVLGVLVSAQAQVLKASLDDAVHTSPFLSDAEKASVMSLD